MTGAASSPPAPPVTPTPPGIVTPTRGILIPIIAPLITPRGILIPIIAPLITPTRGTLPIIAPAYGIIIPTTAPAHPLIMPIVAILGRTATPTNLRRGNTLARQPLIHSGKSGLHASKHRIGGHGYTGGRHRPEGR